MQTKERFRCTVRLVSFGILLLATALRLAHELPLARPQAAAPIEITQSYPLKRYEPPHRTSLLFTPNDAALVPIVNWSGAQPDMAELIARPLRFAVSDKPTILIVHTHATEAYRESAGYRSSDKSQNVVHIGALLAQRLNESGIPTLHDTTLIDAEGYYDSYERAAQIIEGYLQQYPSIQMVIDVHRDSIADADGTQLALTSEIDGQSAAQLMLVMGTDTAGLYHPNWQENLAFALKLQSLCEKQAAGLFRDLNLRSERYNQHLTPHSILIEVGTAGNSMQQAEVSIGFFAEQLANLLQNGAS